MLCADLVQVSWTDHLGAAHQCSALLEDISASGACLQFEKAIPVGCTVRLLCSGAELEGRTRYCVYHDIGYFVGVGFTPGRRWSRSRYEPRHLLDPRSFLK